MKKYHIATFGCQMNISDSDRIASVLESIGYNLASNINEANLVVVNMCSVRQSAVDRIFGLVENIKKLKRTPFTVLTGCILEKDKRKFSKEFNCVVDIKDIVKLPEILGQKEKIELINYFNITPKFSDFIAYIPIMTGCNNYCAYCVVPYVRGKEISRPIKEIIKEVKTAIKNGAKEIWLLGQNVNSFAADNKKSKKPGKHFADLLKEVNKIEGDFWIKFTSSHPKDFSEDIIKAIKTSKKVAKYLNLPIQAGDDAILKKMNRPYTIEQYKKIIRKVRKAMPDITLSTDIIVGFPGETKKHFKNSVNLFKEIKFDMAYLNKYSQRHGTAAAKMKDNVTKAEKDKREKELNEVLKETAFQNNKKHIGEKETVLVLEQKKDFYMGKTEGNKTIKIIGANCRIGDFVMVKITNALPWGLEGKLM